MKSKLSVLSGEDQNQLARARRFPLCKALYFKRCNLRYLFLTALCFLPQLSYACAFQPPLFQRVIIPVALVVLGLILAFYIYKLSSKFKRNWWVLSVPIYILVTGKFYYGAIVKFNYSGSVDCNDPFFVDSLFIFSISLLFWLLIFVINKYSIYKGNN